jgi:hypothetical protein
MEYSLLKSADIKTHYLRNEEVGYSQACLLTHTDGAWLVMAKSIVKTIVEKDYGYRKDPYIKRIITALDGQLYFFQVRDKKVLQRVWDSASGDFNRVVFAPARELMTKLPEIFPEVDEDILLSVKAQLEEVLDKLSVFYK